MYILGSTGSIKIGVLTAKDRALKIYKNLNTFYIISIKAILDNINVICTLTNNS